MATDRSTKIRVATALPPRTLNVEKFAESRASEVEALHSIVSNRLNNDFRSCRNKRRRTTGYDNRGAKNRSIKKQKVGLVDASNDDALKKGKKKAPRYIRRKVELRKNPRTGFCTSGDGTKRLRTHIWHAKRFTMTKLWGFHLSFGLQGRGRGSRALLKWVKHGAVVHDASYTGAVQLEGPEDLLLSILSAVLEPSPSALSEELSRNVLSGVIYACAMLHHVGPHFSHTIAPVTYMWPPIHQQFNTGVDREGHNIDGCDDPNKNGSSSSFRQVWIWIHAAAFKEGYDALKSVCQKLMDESGTSIKCISLEGQIAKLEVMGSKACQLLRKTLHPVSCSVAEADIETQVKNAPNFDEEQISASSIISLTVNDPRASTMKGAVIPEESIKEDETKGQQDLTRIPEREIEVLSSLCLKPELSGDLSGCIDLWDASNGICPPLEESVLCTENHHQRLAFFCLSDRKSVELNESNKGQCSRLCPILLLRHNNLRDTITRWSIILPLSWVRAFWVPLISSGAHAIGLREKHWISSEVGLPYFPPDFPDCKAYSCFMETEAAVSDHTAILRPPSMRPFRVPIPPPWDSVQFSFEQKSIQVGDGQSNLEKPCDKNMINDSSGFPLEGFVARTSYMLTCFLNNINGDNLLLFLNMADRKRCISKFMKDEGMLGWPPTGPISLSSYGKKLCFVRVLLHAYKEGVFEEGAVVCAPHFTDITLWTSRSDNDKVELQIPESSSKSYFVQQPSGKWELQVPKDPVANESHRWPIGFVTSGFVRGSKKPVAVALCEAVLMAHLREEQWHGVAVKRRRKEIYVLVRNQRSTAYRLALANIVLEQQEEDVDYF